ncbi:MAG: hypothetical protein Q8M92_02720, partial [Candidatus Subteraquimicrobiales bacterium]|nr:hypothetical protein [Candidatus Subteraquimicrobiales bacterium]
TVGRLVKQANELLKSFHAEQEELASKLRDNLAKGECLRKKDFDLMMESIRAQRKKRENEAAGVLERFQREEEEMIAELRKIITSGERTRLEEFKTMKESILARQKEREERVREVLRNFHLEQEELGAGLRRLLSKNESVRIKDFKAMVKAVRVQQRERESEVGKMLEDFRRAREEVSAEWQNLAGSMERRRGLTASSS